MNAASNLEFAEVATSRAPEVPRGGRKESGSAGSRETADDGEGLRVPTEEELSSLRRVSGEIPAIAFSVAFVEMCERFSYYGTTAVFVNFIQQPLPQGSNTGAGFTGQSGALDMGQRASTGLTTFNQFWAYLMPLFGAYVAEKYWGRFKTIQYSVLFALVGHVILIISAIPPVVIHPKTAIGVFTLGLVIMGVGTGGFKSNISPLIAEQCKETKICVKITKRSLWGLLEKGGEEVIMDPAVTISRVYLYFYMMINLGSLLGSVSMVWAEKYVGFWLSYTLPTAMLAICPLVMWACKSRYLLTEPGGAVLSKAVKLWFLAITDKWSWNPLKFRRNVKAPGFWDPVRPSQLDISKPTWMDFEDSWVDEVRRGLLACKVFLWYPIYWLAYNQMSNNLTSQAATLKLNGIPNDIVSNFNPISVMIFIPFMDFIVYPSLRKMHFNFTPIKRIATGFALASFSMIAATVTQSYIYKTNPCGKSTSTCRDSRGNHIGSPISVWVQIVPYGLIGFSEIMASVTALEYAYTKAPTSMRSTVTAIALFMSAISAAVAQALVALSEDPLLVWNYAAVAVVSALGGIWFWLSNRSIDREEDTLNNLSLGKILAREKEAADNEQEQQFGILSNGETV
ncbi:putative peptide transporter ptr2 [Bisporella sp. PMI_857]|nr:putative peptide transporter ptr2 [Bisporella sp. PMI_857]